METHNSDHQIQFNHEKNLVKNRLFKQFKKLKKKESELLEQIKTNSKWAKVQHEGDLIKFYYSLIKKGTSTLTVKDWITDQPYQLSLDPLKTANEEMSARFRKAKKMQMSIEPLSKYLKVIEDHLSHINEQLHQLDLVKTDEELSVFKALFKSPSPKPQTTLLKTSPKPVYREFHSESGLKILVGKSAKSNDYLTFRVANGNDWWLHAKGFSGSHVLIPINKGKEPDPETLKDAMQLALYYSKAWSQGEGEICLTQKKYLSKLGKKAGLVQISKHQTIWIRSDLSRYKEIIKRKGSEND